MSTEFELEEGYVIIQGYRSRVRRRDDLKALEELKKFDVGNTAIDCKKAMKGLYILQLARVPPHIYNMYDQRLAEVVRSGACGED